MAKALIKVIALSTRAEACLNLTLISHQRPQQQKRHEKKNNLFNDFVRTTKEMFEK